MSFIGGFSFVRRCNVLPSVPPLRAINDLSPSVTPFHQSSISTNINIEHDGEPSKEKLPFSFDMCVFD